MTDRDASKANHPAGKGRVPSGLVTYQAASLHLMVAPVDEAGRASYHQAVHAPSCPCHGEDGPGLDGPPDW